MRTAERRTPANEADRRLVAILRGRRRWLLRHLGPKHAAPLRLLSALFHCSFPLSTLRTEPPGVAKVQARRSWVALGRTVELPPPTGIARSKPLVQALVAVPTPKGAVISVVPSPSNSKGDGQRLAQRALAVQSLLKAWRCELELELPVGQSAESRARFLGFGALIEGELPPGYFERDDAPIHPLDGRPWATAPTLLSATLSVLALEPWPGGTEDELHSLTALAAGVELPLWRVADPDLAAAARAALRSRTPALPFRVVALSSTNAATRAAAHALAERLRGTGPRSAADAPEPPDTTPATVKTELWSFSLDQAPPAPASPAPVKLQVASQGPSSREVLGAGRLLALQLLKAMRTLPEAAQEVRAELRERTLTRGFPTVLLRELDQAVRRGARGNAPPTWLEAYSGDVTTLRDGSGAEWGRGLSQAHAWIRGLSLLTAARDTVQIPEGPPPLWLKISRRLQKPVTRRTLLVAVEPTPPPGPPNDPLNAGPKRELGFRRALVALLRPGERPSAHELPAPQAVHRLLTEGLAGAVIEFVPGDALAQRVEARLSRLIARCQKVPKGSTYTAEVGGRAFTVDDARGFRSRSMKRFARRPVKSVIDPESPELGSEVTLGRDLRCAPHQLECLVWTFDGKVAELAFADARGLYLREQVPLARLEAYLAETRELVRHGEPCALSVRVCPDVARLLATAPAPTAKVVSLGITGELLGGLSAELSGERYLAGTVLGWEALALSILSQWPMRTRGELSFSSVLVSLKGQLAAPLDVLYARSLIRRRLLTHIDRLSRT